MHEFSLASALCNIVIDEACRHGAVRVNTVRCRVGVLRQVVPELLHTAFTACAEGTLAAGAELVLEVDAARLACRACGVATAVEDVVRVCPACGSEDVVLSGGDALIVAALEIDQEASHGSPGAAAGSGCERCDRG